MGGGDDHAVEVEQLLQQRAGQRRALGRVGTGAEFVQQDEGLRAGGLDDAHDVGHVRREGGERLFDRLLVADVGEDVVEDGDARAGLGGHGQSGLGHQAEQSDGLERDRLAAGVGSGDQHAAGVGGQGGRDRDDIAAQRVGVEQRVSGRVEDQVARFAADPVEAVVLGRQRGIEFAAQSGLGLS